MITCNDLLKLEGIDPASVHVARHQDNRLPPGRLHEVWRADRALFEACQSIQGRKRFDVCDIPASFIVTGARKTVFIDLYQVENISECPPGMIDPLLGSDVTGSYLYDLTLDDRLVDYADKLVIDWGPSACVGAAGSRQTEEGSRDHTPARARADQRLHRQMPRLGHDRSDCRRGDCPNDNDRFVALTAASARRLGRHAASPTGTSEDAVQPTAAPAPSKSLVW